VTGTAAAGLPPADLLPVQRRATLAYRLLRLVLVPLLRLVFSWRIEGRENIPRDGNYIVIANHLNWLDPFAVLLTCPVEPRVHFLGNPEGLVTHAVQWRLVRAVGGYIAVDPHQHGDRALYHYVNVCLRAGGAVGLFPEGQYGRSEGALEALHSGFAHFAVDNQVPIVPLALSGTLDLWLRKPVAVRVGEAFRPGIEVPALVEEARRRLTELLPAYVEASGPRLLRQRLTHLL
jgi:1-acyl-sn-glycerol-3-phosphate acyltransferase